MLLKRNRHRRRLLFLPPGFLALSLFAFSGTLSLLKNERMQPVLVIQLSFAKTTKDAPINIYGLPAKDHTRTIRLMEEKKYFEIQSHLIDTTLRNCQARYDTSVMLRFNFSDSLPWQHFIGLIDMFNKYEYNCYQIRDNTIYAWIYQEAVSAPIKCNLKKLPPHSDGYSCGLQYVEKPRDYEKEAIIEKQILQERALLVMPYFSSLIMLSGILGLLALQKLLLQLIERKRDTYYR